MTDQKAILIIDDEISVRESLTAFFEDENYIVFSAEDGQSGLDIFFANKIDIVITDLRMPHTDGIDVMKAIHHFQPDTPMIVVSGAGEKDDIIKVLRLGAKDYITKPITNFATINHSVTQVLENTRLIKENRQYRQQLEKSEHQYRTITEQIAEGVFTVNALEDFTYANQAFCTMVGYSSEELLQKNVKHISTKESFHIIQEQTQKRQTGLTGRYEIEIVNKSNQVVHVELAASPLLGDKKEYQGAIAVVRDITAIIELRKKFKKFLVQRDTPSKDVLPICASCKSIRVKNGNWVSVEDYFTDILFSHGICSACCEKLYPEIDLSGLDEMS